MREDFSAGEERVKRTEESTGKGSLNPAEACYGLFSFPQVQS